MRPTKVALAAAGAFVVLGSLLIAAAPKQEKRTDSDTKARLRFRLESITAALALGDWEAAFVEGARLRHERRSDAAIAALVAPVLEIADEGRRNPAPAAWDYDRLAKAWSALAENETATASLRTLAENRVKRLAAERRAAERVHAMLTQPEHFAKMRVAVELVREHGATLVVRAESATLAQVRATFETRLRDDASKQLKSDEPEWDAIVARLDEGATLLGSLDGDLKRMRADAHAGLEDRRLMERAIDAVNASEWARAADLLSRLRGGSRYAALAEQAKANIRFQTRLEEAVAAFRGGQGARASNDLAELAGQWPRGLRNADVVAELAREFPRIVADMADADRRRAAGELRRATVAYEAIAANAASEGWYRRESRDRAAACRAELAKTLEKTAKDFAAALDAQDWMRALDQFEALAMVDAEGRRLAAARQRVALLAGTICREIERRCWSGTFGARDRAAAALLEVALKGTDENRKKLEQLKKAYAKNFDGRQQ